MTYCVGVKLDAGLVFLSDSRTNAGLDQISTFRKMMIYEKPGDRFMVMLSAGNLSISQQVREILQIEELHEGDKPPVTIWNATSMFDAARVLAVAVMIENSLNPLAPHRSRRTVRKNRRVLDRNRNLVVVAIRDPAADLRARRAAFIEHPVEWMVDVIGGPAFAKLRLELLAAPRFAGGARFERDDCSVHTVNSMPSNAISASRPRRAPAAA